MRRFLALCLAGLGAAPPVEAGAWPQERGSWFASAAVHLTWPQDVTTWTGLQPTGRFVPTTQVLQGPSYFNGLAPLERSWRSGDSVWALADDEELEAAL